ncbi:MAG: pyridoxal kinase [Thiotrichales bacterium]|nr:pyridoxal kinase [Thiotrichales bacterium]
MAVLSIQSQVVRGYVGNSAAVFVLQRLGHEVWPLNTLIYSNHPGHRHFTGAKLEPELVASLLEGLSPDLAHCEAVLSGYLGQAAMAAVVEESVERVRVANGNAVYVLDPVMGDSETGLFVAQEVADVICDRLLPLADIVTPNVFELELLTRHANPPGISLVDRARLLLERGVKMVVVTGVPTSQNSMATWAVTPESAWQVETDELEFPGRPNGAGDFFAACLTAHLLTLGCQKLALEYAVANVSRALEYVVKHELDDIDPVRSQQVWSDTSRRNRATEL